MSADKLPALVAIALLTIAPAHAVTIETVPIGNPDNPADFRYDANGIGSVPYSFRMGKFEITNAQYVEFLNAVAASDPYGLYSTSMASDSRGGIVRTGTPGSFAYAIKLPVLGGAYSFGNKPAVFVNWFSAIRFANWLHNGQGDGDTEDGAYTLLAGTPIPSNAHSIARNPGARWWLPNEDEWYKAAYFDPNSELYLDYPTGTNAVPDNNLPVNDTGNSANFFHSAYTTGSLSFPMTDIGAYVHSASPFGTFDQGGNVAEWNENVVSSLYRRIRGGSWAWTSTDMRASAIRFAIPADVTIGRVFDVGFRVATVVPEPSTLLLAAFGLVAVFLRRGRRTAP